MGLSDVSGSVTMGTAHTTGLICLLAGFSTRMGSPKQHLQVGERTFLQHILHTMEPFRDRLDPPLFLIQAEDNQAQEHITAWGGTWLINPDPAQGPLSSIRIGLEHLAPHQGCIVWPIDHCLVTADTIAAILEAERLFPNAIIVPSTGDRRGHPPLFPAWTREHLRQAPSSEGARWVLRQFPEAVHHVVVTDPWIITNMNTPEALAAAWRDLPRRQAPPDKD